MATIELTQVDGKMYAKHFPEIVEFTTAALDVLPVRNDRVYVTVENGQAVYLLVDGNPNAGWRRGHRLYGTLDFPAPVPVFPGPATTDASSSTPSQPSTYAPASQQNDPLDLCFDPYMCLATTGM